MTLETKNDDNRTVLRVVINFDLGLMNKFIRRSLNFISKLHKKNTPDQSALIFAGVIWKRKFTLCRYLDLIWDF